jgi:hypothetical protein
MESKSEGNPDHGLSCEIVFVTPELAAEWLELMVDRQRNISRTNLRAMERQFSEGRMTLNGQALIFGKSGACLDGQHRLTACLNTRRGWWTVVVRGVEDELFATIDSGISRRLRDTLKIGGRLSTSDLVSSLQRLDDYLHRRLYAPGSERLANFEGIMLLDRHPRLLDSVHACNNRLLKAVVATGRVAWLHYLGTEKCAAPTEYFFARLGDGARMEIDDPIYLLRGRLLAERAAKSRLPLNEVLALLVKAWNAHLAGERMKQLKWNSERGEKFPTVRFPKAAAPDEDAPPEADGVVAFPRKPTPVGQDSASSENMKAAAR